jgi:hypothetical protein
MAAIEAAGWRDDVWARNAAEAAEAAAMLFDRGRFALALSGEPVRVSVRRAGEPAETALVFAVQGRVSVEYRAVRQIIDGSAG